MPFSPFSKENQLIAAKKILGHLGDVINARFSVQLWDGTKVPLGANVDTPYYLAIRDAGVLGSLIRRPTLANFVRTYATGGLSVEGGEILDFASVAVSTPTRKITRKLKKTMIARQAMAFLFAKSKPVTFEQEYVGDAMGHKQARRDEKNYIQFHYDIGNDFYELFLDAEMQYSCGYFTDWENSLEQAQIDKLEMICRKLRLRKGEKMLDIGCGWGGLSCHAAREHGVHVHGVTLSQAQHDYAQDKVRTLGLEGSVNIELRDYASLDGPYDKIASIGMYEHVGIANYPKYFKKVHGLLNEGGLFLNHGITRRARRTKKRLNPGKRFIQNYIFPGSELDHIGHSIEVMEACRFEIYDVESWREHYARTMRFWSERLSARREEAIALVGLERYRMWSAYLVGVHLGFVDGSLRIYQTLGSKHAKNGPSGLPPTRADLYALD